MSHKQGKTHRLLDFFAGKGFYVVLILCVAAIGASGYMLFFGGSGETPDSPSLALTSPGRVSPAPPSISAPPRAAEPSANPSPAPAVLPPSTPPPLMAPSPPADPAQPQSGTDDRFGSASVSGPDEPDSVEAAAPVTSMPPAPPETPEPPSAPETAANVIPDFYPPVSGEMLVGFSESADVFYEALREWRYHPGIDIETNAGALVQAAADGVVKAVIENAPRHMGATIVIEHAGGYVTVYSNLSSTLTASVGKTVKAGDAIGSVGETSIAEQELPPHLHFEILKDGEPVDPADYLP